MGRIIGVKHRVKKTVENESRPTLLAIKEGEKNKEYKLETEQEELDFVLGIYPIVYREAKPDEDLSVFRAHHIKERKKAGAEEKTKYVPEVYDGLRPSDVVVMPLGGSGDRFAFALSRRGEEIGAKVYRITPRTLMEKLTEPSRTDKESDLLFLVDLFNVEPTIFYEVGPRERDMILVRELTTARKFTMKDRIACGNRLRQQAVGEIFLSKTGKYPEGTIEAAFDETKANSLIFNNLLKEEARIEKELKKAVEALPVWKNILADVSGCGSVIAAGIISPVTDIRRFHSKAAFQKFMGVHVMADGKFPRKKRGQAMDYNPSARQALYLLGDQFVRRPDTKWGEMLKHYKIHFRTQHPEIIEESGKKRYTNGHIHKMAIWRTLTIFAGWLYDEWWKLEGVAKEEPKQLAEEAA